MVRFLYTILFLVIASAASAQNVTVIGPVTPGHVPIFNSTTVIKDSGTAGGAQSVNWINVKNAPCNAVGNGVADDTAAINTCIANFNTATNGVLYFPAGTYKVTSALTAITANGIIRGDGQTALNPLTSQIATLIDFTSTTATLFTINASKLTFADLSLQNTAGSTPSSGAGILATSSNIDQKVDYYNIQVANFFINIDIKVGSLWSMINTSLFNSVQDGVRINNTVNTDAGDWTIANSQIYGGANSTTGFGIRIEGSGGGKIVNTKINGGPGTASFTNGIDVVGVGATVILLIANSSIENISGSGINVSGSWPDITIMGLEMSGFNPTGTHAINIANTSNVVISGVTTSTNWSGTPINLSSCTNCYVSGLMGFATPFSGGNRPDHDGTGGIGTFYFKDNTAGVESKLDWTGPAGQTPELRVVLDPTTTTLAAVLAAVNDAGHYARMLVGGTGGSPANGGRFSTDAGPLVFMADDQTSTGGTDDVLFYAGGFSQKIMTVQHQGHIAFTGGTAPTLTAGCNGAGSVVSGTDAAGTITGQTAVATTCTLTFGTAYAATPNCVASGQTAPLTGAFTPSTTTLVVNFASAANFKWSYICHG